MCGNDVKSGRGTKIFRSIPNSAVTVKKCIRDDLRTPEIYRRRARQPARRPAILASCFYYAYSQESAPPSRIIGTVGSKGGSSAPNEPPLDPPQLYERALCGFRTMRSDLYRVFLARLHARRLINQCKVRKKRGGNCLLCLYASYAPALGKSIRRVTVEGPLLAARGIVTSLMSVETFHHLDIC